MKRFLTREEFLAGKRHGQPRGKPAPDETGLVVFLWILGFAFAATVLGLIWAR